MLEAVQNFAEDKDFHEVREIQKRILIYGLVREGGREYEGTIMWFCDCELVRKVSSVNSARMPLKAYEDLRAFKLFIDDTGEWIVLLEVYNRLDSVREASRFFCVEKYFFL